MNQYRVHPFHIQTSEDQPILVTGQAVIKLVNDAFSRLLHRVRDEGATLLTEEMLAQRTADEGLPHEATRDFLLARGILRLLGRSDERISLVRIASTDEQWCNMLCSNITGVPVEASTSLAPNASDLNGTAVHQLWVLLLPRYSEERIAKFYTELSQVPGTSGLIVYFRFRTLCVSSVYSPAYGTPCHFCYVGWESRVKAAPGTGTASISALLRTFEGQVSMSYRLRPCLQWTGLLPARFWPITSNNSLVLVRTNSFRKRSRCATSLIYKPSSERGMSLFIGLAAIANTGRYANHDTRGPSAIRGAG